MGLIFELDRLKECLKFLGRNLLPVRLLEFRSVLPEFLQLSRDRIVPFLNVS